MSPPRSVCATSIPAARTIASVARRFGSGWFRPSVNTGRCSVSSSVSTPSPRMRSACNSCCSRWTSPYSVSPRSRTTIVRSEAMLLA